MTPGERTNWKIFSVYAVIMALIGFFIVFKVSIDKRPLPTPTPTATPKPTQKPKPDYFPGEVIVQTEDINEFLDFCEDIGGRTMITKTRRTYSGIRCILPQYEGQDYSKYDMPDNW